MRSTNTESASKPSMYRNFIKIDFKENNKVPKPASKKPNGRLLLDMRLNDYDLPDGFVY